MRTVTASELHALSARDRSTHVRVWVDRTGTGIFADLTDLGGIDWVDSVSIDESVDAMSSSCSVTLRREAEGKSLSPLMEASTINTMTGAFVPVIDIARAIYVEVCVLGYGVSPASSDWREIFRGKIDDLDMAKESVTLKCLDQYDDLVKCFIETVRPYGSDAGADMEDVIQALLDDNAGSVTLFSLNGTAGTPFNASDSPGFAILLYEQQQQSLAEAIDAIVRLIGWVCRYQWHANTSAFQLQLLQPDRAKTTPDHEFSADDYFTLEKLSISRSGIRNAIEVEYTDASTGLRKTNVSTDATSIARYGRLYMKLGEGDASHIDSSTEGAAYAAAALADLKDPSAEQSTSQLFYWPAQLGDLYRYSANGVHYDTDKDLALVGIRHQLSGGFGRSSFDVRGKPSGGYRRWLRLDAGGQPIIGGGVVGPKQANTNTTGATNIVPNGEFGAWSRDVEQYLPDGWRFALPSGIGTLTDKGSEYTFGSSGDAYYSASVTRIGATSLKLTIQSGYDVAVESKAFPVREGESYDFGFDYNSGNNASSPAVGVWVRWLDAAKTHISTDALWSASAATDTWYSVSRFGSAGTYVTAPSGARFAQTVIIANHLGTVGKYIYLDRMWMEEQ